LPGSLTAKEFLKADSQSLQSSNGAKYHNSGHSKCSGEYASIKENTEEHSTALSSGTAGTNNVSEYDKISE
jgi:hypothetical protein